MSCYIGQYVKTCDLCLHTKAQQHLPVRELSPLPILESCWETISIDFIVKLPESHGYNAIMNVVDLVSKVSVLEPIKTLVLRYNTSVSNLCSEVKTCEHIKLLR